MASSIMPNLFSGLMPRPVAAPQTNAPRCFVPVARCDPRALRNAIGKIENKTGGKIVDINYAEIDGTPSLHFAVAIAGKIKFMHAEATTQLLS